MSMVSRRKSIASIYAKLLLALSIAFAGGCDNSSDNSSTDLKSSVVVNDLFQRTGKVHLDLNGTSFDPANTISHSVRVTDMQSGEVVLEMVDIPAGDINNQRISFSPLYENMPHGVLHDMERSLLVEHTVRDSNGELHQSQETIDLDYSFVLGNLGETITQEVPNSRVAAKHENHNTSDGFDGESSCTVVCSPQDELVICTLPTDSGCTYASLSSEIASDTENVLHVANLATDTEITPHTSMWIQAIGGYGGRSSKHKHFEASGARGGHGGFAQTATTIAKLRTTSNLNPDIYYYVANTGSHGLAGSGGPSTIVSTKPINGLIKSDVASDISSNDVALADILLIAGGGGGGGTNGTFGNGGPRGYVGGSGGVATPADATSILIPGEDSVGFLQFPTGQGGGSDFDVDGDDNIVHVYGGEGGHHSRSGYDGFGGNSGHEENWLNTGVTGVGDPRSLGHNGQGGQSTSAEGGSGDLGGGGGGGAGGGSSGDSKQGIGGGGGGSYAKGLTITDNDFTDRDEFKTPSNDERNSAGSVRIIFNSTVSISMD